MVHERGCSCFDISFESQNVDGLKRLLSTHDIQVFGDTGEMVYATRKAQKGKLPFALISLKEESAADAAATTLVRFIETTLTVLCCRPLSAE